MTEKEAKAMRKEIQDASIDLLKQTLSLIDFTNKLATQMRNLAKRLIALNESEREGKDDDRQTQEDKDAKAV